MCHACNGCNHMVGEYLGNKLVAVPETNIEELTQLPELIKAAHWALRTLDSLSKKEAELKNTTFEMCEYTGAKALRRQLAKFKTEQDTNQDPVDTLIS